MKQPLASGVLSLVYIMDTEMELAVGDVGIYSMTFHAETGEGNMRRSDKFDMRPQLALGVEPRYTHITYCRQAHYI